MSRNAFRAASLIVLALAAVWLVPLARAGTTGKLSGRVVNEKREPVAGANIRLEGLRLGALSDEEGNYYIIGIPAGVYTVRANLLGHAPYVVQNVQIRPDFTTTLNVTLTTEAVQMQEVRVDAERPLLQRDATGTTRFIGSEDIQKLPTRGYRDAAAQQTGIVNFQLSIDNEVQNQNTLIVRGGRPNETAYFVDGFSQQDPLTGTSTTSINNNSIEEVVVLTGGFAPEYGRIMSGAVNVITREGGSRLFGAVEAVSDVLAGDWIGARKTDYNIYDVSLGGPILPGSNQLTFYVSGERRWQRDRQPSFMSDAFKDELRTGALAEQMGVERTLDDNFKPNNSSAGNTFQGKLSWQPADQFNFKLGGIGSEESWRQYAHTYFFNLDHSPKYIDKNQSYYVSGNYIPSTSTFYNLGVNFFRTLRKRGDGIAFDNLDPHYVGTGDTLFAEGGRLLNADQGYFRAVNPNYDLNLPIFWGPGHVYDDFLQRESEYWGIQGSVTSQLDRYNQLKAGGDFQRHTLRLFNHFFPTQLGGPTPNLIDYDSYGYALDVEYRDVVVRNITEDGDTLFSNARVPSAIKLVDEDEGAEDGPKHPKTFALFVQDKFEREGVILNGGLRYDYMNVDTKALRSEQFPLGNPDAVGGATLEDSDLQDNKTYSRISPRLGVAFPVDDKTQLRFNYGQFYQQPNLQDLYVSYRFLESKIQRGGYFVGFGNPNLKPERTTAYEVGMARQLGDRIRFDATAYYKDVKDLVEVTTISSFPNNFSSYRNRDYATIKGVDVGFTMRPINHVSGNVAYSLSFAHGTGSVSNTQSNIAWTATQPPKQTAPLDFDQRHKLSLNADLRFAKGEGPIIGGARLLENFGINFLFNVASGTPYTPTNLYNEVTLAAITPTAAGPLNSRYGPWTSNLDIKASKGFGFGGLNFEGFVWVLNAFDNQNAITVYTSSGSPFATGFLNTESGQAFVQNASDNGYDGPGMFALAENNPGLYSNPRLVRFGLRASF